MGDADNTPNMMSVEEVEALMENAWNDLDDGLDGLFSFVNLLNEHNAYMMSEIASWQRLRRCFMALNVFVIPIMLSIWIAFGSTDIVAPNSSAEVVLQTIVMALMMVSGAVGFPLYVLAMMKTIFGVSRAEDDAQCLSKLNSETSGRDDRRASAVEDAEPSQELQQRVNFRGDSLDRISEFARQANRRFLDNVRQDLERRASRVEESVMFEPSESEVDNRVATAERQLIDLDAGGFKDPSDDPFPGNVHKEEADFYGFKVIILNKTQDLSVEIEKQEEAPPPSSEDEYRLGSSVRNIAVENVGEGDNNRVSLKDNTRDSLAKDGWQGQVFGL